MVDTDNEGNEAMLKGMAESMAVGMAAEFALKKMAKHGSEAIAAKLGKRATKKVVSKSIIKKVQKSINQLVTKKLKSLLNSKIIKLLKKTIQKAGIKAGKVAAVSAGKAGTVAATGCATTGVQTAGAGCAASAAVGTLMFMWDMTNMLWDLMDYHGITIVFNEEMIQDIGKEIETSINDAFAELQPPGSPPYLDSEVTFDPLAFVFVTDEDFNLIVSEKWGAKYFNHIDHFMTKIKKHSDNWEELISQDTSSEEEEKQFNEEKKKELSELPEPELIIEPDVKSVLPKNKSSQKVILVILLILFSVVSIYFVPLSIIGWGIFLIIYLLRINNKKETYDDIEKIHKDHKEAEIYAESKMCVDIPSEYIAGSTRWDQRNKVCRITQRGCNQRDRRSPFTQPTYNLNGKDISHTYENSRTRLAEFWKIQPPEELIWKPTKASRGVSVCARSNHMLKKFCEYPTTRLSEDGSKQQRGVTNVPKFQYTISQGKETCKMTKAYCDAKGLSYNRQRSECVLPKGQKIFEDIFGGSVIARSIRAGVPPPNPADPKQMTATVNKFKAMSDRRLKKNIKLFRTDFLDKDINLYIFEWSQIAKKIYGFPDDTQIGFMADELPDKYTSNDLNGYKYIHTDENDIISKRLDIFYKFKNILYNK